MLNVLLLTALTAVVSSVMSYTSVYLIIVCFEIHDKLFHKSRRTVEEIIVDKDGNVTYL